MSVEKEGLPLEVFEARQAERKSRVLAENMDLFPGYVGGGEGAAGGEESASLTDSARQAAEQPNAVLPAWVDNVIKHSSAPGNEAHDTTASDQFYPNSTPPTVSNDQQLVYVNGQRWVSTKTAAQKSGAANSGSAAQSGAANSGELRVSACVCVSCKCIVMMH